MLIPSAYCALADDNSPSGFILLIDIEVNTAQRVEIALRLDDYAQQLRRLFPDDSGYLGAELLSADDCHLLGCLKWRRREDWEAAWDCQRTQSRLFADSLLQLGAKSIQFDSFLVAEPS